MEIEDRMRKIIEQAYSIVCSKIISGRITIHNEASLQLQLGIVLKILGALYEFGKEDKFSIEFEHTFILTKPTNKCKNKHARADIYMELTDGKDVCSAIIELKYFKKKNARQPNNRYDFFADLENLEQYQDQRKSQVNYLIAGTDHNHYYSNDEPLSADTGDFNFRDGMKYHAGTVLQYKTEKSYGNDIELAHDYSFNWDIFAPYAFIIVKV
jgi:hypothetical protein